MAWDQRAEGFTDEEARDLRDQFGDIWFQLATLLGHNDPATTRDHYLEPFTSLQASYLMALLDEDEHTTVEALIRSAGSHGGRTLTGRISPAAGASEGRRA